MKDNYNALREHYGTKEEGYYDQQRPEMLEFVPANTRTVLEIGCSGGGFGALLKKTRPEIQVWGVEPDAIPAQKASDRLDKVINSVFQEGMPELENRRFDCIVFNDVLEHIVDPAAMLRTARGYLAPEGVVVASIPNVLFFINIAYVLIKQDWRYQESGILDFTHLRFFTRKSIVRMFEESGYVVDNLKGINRTTGLSDFVFRVATLGMLYDWRYVQFAIVAREDHSNVKDNSGSG